MTVIESNPEPKCCPTSTATSIPRLPVGRMVFMLSSNWIREANPTPTSVSAAPAARARTGWRMHSAVRRLVPKLCRNSLGAVCRRLWWSSLHASMAGRSTRTEVMQRRMPVPVSRPIWRRPVKSVKVKA